MRTFIRDVLIVGLGLPILFFLIGMVAPRLADPIETVTYDWRLRVTPLPARCLSNIVLVDIDDTTVDSLGDPDFWPRSYYARVVDSLASARMVGLYVPLYHSVGIGPEAIRDAMVRYDAYVTQKLNLKPGAGSIVVGFILNQASRDRELAYAISRKRQVFLTYWATDRPRGQGPAPFTVNLFGTREEYKGGKKPVQHKILPADIIKRTRFVTPLRMLVWGEAGDSLLQVGVATDRIPAGMGFGELYPDPDGINRSQPLLVLDDSIAGIDNIFPSFAFSMAVEYLKSSDGIWIPTGDRLKVGNDTLKNWIFVNVEPGARLRYLKASRGLKTVSFLDLYNGMLASDLFRDKVVFIGSSVKDFGPLPRGGAREQTAVFANIINGLHVSRSPHAVSFLLSALLGLGMAFAILRYRPVIGVPAAIAGPALYIIVCFVGFVAERTWIEMVMPTVCLALVAAAGFIYKNATEGRSKKLLMTVLEKRLPSTVGRDLVRKSGASLGLKPATVTLVRVEIKNLSPLIPQYPEIAALVLEEFIGSMVEVVFAQRGIVTSYLSGGMIAAFGAFPPEGGGGDPDSHAFEAAKAAVEMRRRFSILGARLQAEGRGLLELGVVLDSADVLIGFFKPTQDYQVMGPALALVDNLATLNRRLKTTILVTEHTATLLKEKVRFKSVLESGIAGPTGMVRILELVKVGT